MPARDCTIAPGTGASAAPTPAPDDHVKPTSQHIAAPTTPPPSGFSRPVFLALWTLLLLLHALCGSFLLASAQLYWYMEHEYLAYFAELVAPASERHFRVVGVIFGCLGTLHLVQLTAHILASVRARSPAVRDNAGVRKRTAMCPSGAVLVTLLVLILKNLVRSVRTALYRRQRGRPYRFRPQLTPGLTGLQRVAGINSEHYSQLFALRKTLEIAVQVTQCYRFSMLMARVWINHVKVTLVVANCWAAFAIHRMLFAAETKAKATIQSASSITTQTVATTRPVRFSAVVLDALFTTGSSVVLPAVVFLPYLQQYDSEDFTFPLTVLYGDTAFPRLVLENRALFTVSLVDVVAKTVPHVSIFTCLLTIASLLELPAPAPVTMPPPASPTTWPPVKSLLVVKKARPPASRPKSLFTLVIQRVAVFAHSIGVPLLFLVAGITVLALHVYANTRTSVDMQGACLQPMHPWFSSNFSCAVLNHNCYHHGETSPNTSSLAFLERQTLRSVIFSHCSALEMPTELREFPNLLGIELFNVTLTHWGVEAAATQTTQPELLFVIFAHVNLSAVPVAMLHDAMPKRLTDIELSHTNLTTLPDEIADVWTFVETLYMEHSQLSEFPTALFQLPVLSEVSVIGNAIETLADDLFTTAAATEYVDLAFSRNPLRALPKHMANELHVDFLALEYTELTKLPDWTAMHVWDELMLGGSPLCDGDRSGFPDVAYCGDEAWDELGDGRYPMSLVEPSRPL